MAFQARFVFADIVFSPFFRLSSGAPPKPLRYISESYDTIFLGSPANAVRGICG